MTEKTIQDIGASTPSSRIPFRGRIRVGRGGRVIVDRSSNRINGIAHWWESDQESNER
jgi:hypothetical protein